MPITVMGGTALMRRPALYRPATTPGWAHPYTGADALATFYNGAPAAPPAPAAVPPAPPTPADIAALHGVTPPAPAAAPPAPPAPPANPGDEPVTFTQRRFNTMMAAEKEEGRRAALRAIAESAGIDPDTVDLDQVGKVLKDHTAASRDRMSEVERREADAVAAQAAADARAAAADAREKAAAERDREATLRSALAIHGCFNDPANPQNYADATALLRANVAADADEAAITQAAADLKARRGELFGTPTTGPTPPALPPAPGGAPAGGPPQRVPNGKDAVTDAARQRAISMGLRQPDTN